MNKKKPTKRLSKRQLIVSLRATIELLSSIPDDEFNKIIEGTKQRSALSRGDSVTPEQIERIAKHIAAAPDLDSAQNILSEDRLFASKDALVRLAHHFNIAVLRKDRNESIVARIVRRLQGAPQGREAIRSLKL
jgi:hypothetical protein